MREGQDNARGRTQSEHGDNTQPPLPPFNRTTTQTEGGHQHADGRVGIAPPALPRHATHHHNGTPPSTTAPPSTTTRGEQTEDTPPHEQHGHTLTTRTPQHPAGSSARHDSSTRQHCNGMSRARATPPHRAGQQQHTPPPFHTPRRMDTIHSSTHLLLLIHVHTTDDQR